MLLVSYVTGYRLQGHFLSAGPLHGFSLVGPLGFFLHSASLRTWPVLWKAGHRFGVVPTLSQFCGQIYHMEVQNKKGTELMLSPKERNIKGSAATFDLLDRVA